VSYFAAALGRAGSAWTGQELDLDDVEDLDGVVDELREVSDDAELTLLFVEEDDEWFAVVRIEGDDARVFLSDGRAVETSALGAVFGEAASIADDADDDDGDDDDSDEDEDEEPGRAAGDPVGDADVLSDLGTPASMLLKLCAEEGQLPADIISALCERAGCLDTLEALREG
jgi:putative tRNA adenosine deaminase-associated protein